MIIISMLTSYFRKSHKNMLVCLVPRSNLQQYFTTDMSENSDSAQPYHIPVMLDECMEYLKIKPGGVYVDCTLGGGGHTKAILERGGRVIACDQDTDAILYSSKLLTMYLDSKQLEIIQSNFRDIKTVIPNSHIWNSHISSIRGSDDKGSKIISIGVDGVLMDLGISSHQIDYRARGFSFGQDGPLDMRMDQSIPFDESKFTAATIVNEWNAEDIANLLYQFGDETRSRSITRAIIANRPITTTTKLTEVISRITAWKERPKTLARCFQALRIAVNNEMDALDTALNSMHHIVKPGGRLVIMSYHSLEDRRVKNLLRYGDVRGEAFDDGTQLYKMRLSPYNVTYKNTIWLPIVKRAIGTSEDEINRNKRSRSAKLRVGERIEINNLFGYSSEGDSTLIRQKSIIGAKQLAKEKKRRASELKENEGIDE